MHAGFIKLEFVNGRVIVGVLKRGFQTFELQGTQLVDAGFSMASKGKREGVLIKISVFFLLGPIIQE